MNIKNFQVEDEKNSGRSINGCCNMQYDCASICDIGKYI